MIEPVFIYAKAPARSESMPIQSAGRLLVYADVLRIAFLTQSMEVHGPVIAAIAYSLSCRNTVISTRRFFCLPSAVALSAAGLVSA